MARKVDEPWTKCRNSTDLDRTRALHTTVGILAIGLRRDLVEDSMYWNRDTLRTNTKRGSVVRDVPFAYTTFLDTLLGVSTASSASAQEALKRMSLMRDKDFTAKAVRDLVAEVEGWKPRKKKAPPQPTIVYNTVYNSGAASSATTSSGTPVHREISTPPTPHVSATTRRWRLFVESILQTERIRVPRENSPMMEEDL